MMREKIAAFKAMIAENLQKVSFPSNYIFHFISAFRQTASEALERERERKTLISSVSSLSLKGGKKSSEIG